MRRILAYRCGAVFCFALVASPATADMNGASRAGDRSAVGDKLARSGSAVYEGFAVNLFATYAVSSGGHLTADEAGWLAETLYAGGTVALPPSGYGHVDDERSPTNPQPHHEDSFPAGDADQELTGWTPTSGPEGTHSEASVASNPTAAVGDIRVLDIAWVDGSPGHSELMVVPLPGAFILGAVGLGLTGLAVRRFT